MNLPLSTYALLFPAISLLFLSYTNRFLHLSALIRKLHDDWKGSQDSLLLAQITNLKNRLEIIRWMQLLGALSLTSSSTGMLLRLFEHVDISETLFIISLIFMACSLLCLTREIWISGGALRILLRQLEDDIAAHPQNKTKQTL